MAEELTTNERYLHICSRLTGSARNINKYITRCKTNVCVWILKIAFDIILLLLFLL